MTRKRLKKWSLTERRRLSDLHESGMSPEDIAVTMGRPVRSILKLTAWKQGACAPKIPAGWPDVPPDGDRRHVRGYLTEAVRLGAIRVEREGISA